MFCVSCGHSNINEARFCSGCGKAVAPLLPPLPPDVSASEGPPVKPASNSSHPLPQNSGLPSENLTPLELQRRLAEYAKEYKKINAQSLGSSVISTAIGSLIGGLMGGQSGSMAGGISGRSASSHQANVQKELLRRKVAALGVNVEEWERSIKKFF